MQKGIGMAGIRVMIDGKETIGHDGMTILESAEKVGIHIPTLCHKKELSPTGVCRICVVEVEGSNRLVGACHTPIIDGMVVHTKSHKVVISRKATLELMLAAHPGPCILDSRIEQCALQKLSAELEVTPPRFRVRQPRSYPLEEVSPYVCRDLSKCIMCYRCVKACEELAKKNIYSIGYRGFDTKVIVDCDEPLNKEVCKDCGICIDYCPTSALRRPRGCVREDEKRGDRAGRADQKTFEGDHRKKLLEELKSEQGGSGFVSSEMISKIAQSLNIGVSQAYGVATFYSFLSVKPLGRNVIRICKSLPCHLRNGSMIVESVIKVIGIKPGETTSDSRFSFLLTNCIGACDQAPAMLVNHDVHGNLTPDRISEVLKSYS
jgi:NADH:ubiquinone oxidoreductase subunit E/Pyruvate/2-oxoacid:ferredoxin oxidoreductase delta subunit